MFKKTLTIIDASTLLPGPFATFLLQKYIRANIIKVEDQKAGDKLSELKPTRDGVSLFYTALNSNKKIIKIDFSSPVAGELFKKLLKKGDVFITNFKMSRLEKLGLSPASVSKINPDILYCTINGYPKKHPLSGYGAHDINILSLTGYLSLAQAVQPSNSLPPIQFADLFTSYHIALRILANLFMGKKKVIQVSMLEAMLEAFHYYRFVQLTHKKELDGELSYQNQLPCYHLYKVRDGNVAVGAIETKTRSGN